jgi:hypothetical protein
MPARLNLWHGPFELPWSSRDELNVSSQLLGWVVARSRAGAPKSQPSCLGAECERLQLCVVPAALAIIEPGRRRADSDKAQVYVQPVGGHHVSE